MRILIFPPDLLHKDSFLTSVKTVHKLSRANKQQILPIVIAVGKALECVAAEEFDGRVEAKVPKTYGVVFAGCEEKVFI